MRGREGGRKLAHYPYKRFRPSSAKLQPHGHGNCQVRFAQKMVMDAIFIEVHVWYGNVVNVIHAAHQQHTVVATRGWVKQSGTLDAP